MFRFHQCFQRVYGAALFISGLVGDCLVGVVFATRGNWQLLLWHIPFALVWAMGVNILSHQEQQPTACGSLNRWGLTALLLGVGTFPGCGSGAYSLAFLVARYPRFSFALPRQTIVEPEQEETFGELPSPPERTVYPLVDDLYRGDTEARRAVVAKISRTAHPDATCLLRQLLSDHQAEIRSDASIALARLDEEISRTLTLAFEAWSANPGNTQATLTLADHYYRYAASNVLDNQSQRFYLVQARKLLLQVSAQGEVPDAHMWLQLARIRQRLGELAEALQDVCRALQSQPTNAEARLFAMELAFRTRAWDTLISLVGDEASILPLLQTDVDFAALQPALRTLQRSLV